MRATLLRAARHLFALIILTAGSAAAAHAGGDTPPVGRVLEKVPVGRDATQSYALYLPAAYTPARKYPVLYFFDPGARGAVPVERFKEAAEKYGYILVGSNNSRNGPGVPLRDLLQQL